MPSLVPYLFVYGSLTRRGDKDARRPLAEGGHYLREGSIKGRLYMAEGWPAAVPGDREDEQVHGEVYELKDPAATLAQLDAWEGPGYERGLLPVLMKDQGFEVECWAWTWTRPVDEASRIADGRWKGVNL
jgi:gamma-glutamylcyclotransferase (GGCT)/AIG2-like uncharacterized protein YtfP